MSSPSVSVCMPVYNTERYVAEAVESILAQTFGDFEFIIIDDGSTDGSRAILERYAKQDDRIRLISRPNTGIVGARNEALGLARGELIAVMDSDDVALPERFELQVAYLREYPECVMVGSRVLAMDPEGDPLGEWNHAQSHEEIEEVLLDVNSDSCIGHPAVMMRREAVLEVGKYKDRAPVEDRDLFLRLGERGRLANLPQVLLRYRLHPSSICHVVHSDLMSQLIRRTVLEAYERRGLDASQVPEQKPWPRHPLTACHLMWGWSALMAGHVRSARKHARERLRRAPLSVDSWRLLYCAIRGY
jgi:glycosyltransferase involved in cell wall biosynthesis